MESSIVGCNTIQEMHLPCITTYTLVLKCNNSIVGCNTIQGMQLHVTTLVQCSLECRVLKCNMVLHDTAGAAHYSPVHSIEVYQDVT